MRIRNAYERRSVLIARNAECPSDLGGRNVFECREMCEKCKVLYMFTTNTFAHGRKTSIFAFHCLVMAKRVFKTNTYDPGLHQTMKYKI